jgi:hypothetical protein
MGEDDGRPVTVLLDVEAGERHRGRTLATGRF